MSICEGFSLLQTGYDDGYEAYTEINSFNPYQFEVTSLAVGVAMHLYEVSASVVLSLTMTLSIS